MQTAKLQKIAVAALEDIKGKDIQVINTTKLTSLFDRIIIASADSTRQVKALARNVREKVEEAGGDVIGIEGEDGGEWVLVDLGSIVVHNHAADRAQPLQPGGTLAGPAADEGGQGRRRAGGVRPG
jgi:ribosome-associated protein